MKRTKNYVEAGSVEDLCEMLGFPRSHAGSVRRRLDLVRAIHRYVDKHELTHADAAKKAGLSRTQMTAIMNFDLRRTSIDRLLEIAESLGMRVTLKVA